MKQASKWLTTDTEMQKPQIDAGMPQNLEENVGTGANPRGMWNEWATLQQHQAAKNARLFQALVEHKKTVLEPLLVMQVQACG